MMALAPRELTTFETDFNGSRALGRGLLLLINEPREDSHQETIKASDVAATILINAPFAKVAEKFIW